MWGSVAFDEAQLLTTGQRLHRMQMWENSHPVEWWIILACRAGKRYFKVAHYRSRGCFVDATIAVLCHNCAWLKKKNVRRAERA
jgi:hypothetical protein